MADEYAMDMDILEEDDDMNPDFDVIEDVDQLVVCLFVPCFIFVLL